MTLMEKRFTLLCFSADWSHPLIWAHYSDKHRGLCLGFEIPSEVAKAKTRSVTYIPAALTFPRYSQSGQREAASSS
jgi:hypothetical protein